MSATAIEDAEEPRPDSRLSRFTKVIKARVSKVVAASKNLFKLSRTDDELEPSKTMKVLKVIAKVPWYIANAVEYLVTYVLLVASLIVFWIVLTVAILVILTIALVYAVLVCAGWLVSIVFQALVDVIETPYLLLEAGWDPVKANWIEIGHMVLNPLRRASTTANLIFSRPNASNTYISVPEEMKNAAHKHAKAETEEKAVEAPKTTGKGRPTPRRTQKQTHIRPITA